MSTNTIFISGEAFWTKAKTPDPEYDNYTLDLYQSNTASEIKSYMNELLPLVKNMLQKMVT